ncbi:hypothetical protein TIFTF001_004881 [Ficus carica]|uniref:Uncharacterized protein n=1 Tax=Ficus carica TaxID=3494 RepID=A0AA88CWS7_FICCA|nr:hypothetical protein TIFTF001_004881 [Ficus carica]
MEDWVLSPATMLGVPSDSAMDLDFMDELFLDGCWLETRDNGSEFLKPNNTTITFPSTSTNPLLDPLFVWPNFDTNNNDQSNTTPSQIKTNPEDRHRSVFAEPEQKIPTLENMTDDIGVCYGGSDAQVSTEGGNELRRRWWIGPKTNMGPSSSVVERLYRALVYMKEVIRDKDVLVQIWVPVHREGRRVLITRDLPFALDDNSSRLARYRDVSTGFQFSVEEEEDSKELVMGLPGRVFSGKVPEWTPDVRFFRKDEYPRLMHAKKYDVSGTLALPVFEQGSRNCLGVVEVVMTTQKIMYRPELESVCKALEAVDLKSSEVSSTQIVRLYNKYYQAAIPEIQVVLRAACETHRLPLAQTWVPCIYQDPNIQGFHEACSEHHLFKGQGVVGGAFMTNQPCFSEDITSFTKTEYPLSHYARVFKLHAAVAIRLRSIHTGTADFVLEFFLPGDCTDPEEQKKMLTSLSLIIQQCCRSLRVITDKELEEETDFSVSEIVVPSSNAGPSTRVGSLPEGQQGGTTTDVSSIPEEIPREALNERLPNSSLKPSVECVEECSTIGEGSFSSVGAGKTGERRRTKAEKTITLQVLRQYFAGSLKDAAKSIGVCSTTLKRICRQHGIKRWPSRKIKKVGHSLQKLQLVIDSVQGASGTFQIDSFYTNFPELASPNVSGTSPFSASKPSHDHPKPLLSNLQQTAGVDASKSSSSCSQSSSSSQCCTSRSQQLNPTWNNNNNNVASSEELMAGEFNSKDVVLKRVRSEAGLNNACSAEEDKKLMPRSQSHKSLVEHRKITGKNNVTTPLLKNSSGRLSSQESGGEYQRVKVSYGEEKTRFRLQSNWGFRELQEEIGRRFSIEDMGLFTIKYLDDDLEWVLLTCDADLDECFEVCRLSQNNTIKLSLQVSRHVSRGFFGGGIIGNGPS